MKALDLEVVGLKELNDHELESTSGGFLFFWLVLGFFIGLAIGLNNEE